MSDPRDRIATALLSNRAGSNLYKEERYELADAVIAALRPQLEAICVLCIDSGDMTPMAKRLILKALEQG